jgi:flagellar basal body rod protein FlgG
MLYGLYLSATGVLTNSYRQDVIANNIANAETVGFKRDLALFMERRTAMRESGASPSRSNALLEALGGGVLAAPTHVDTEQGELEPTGNKLDAAIIGQGYFAVAHGNDTNLTRDGRFVVNHKGRLALANNENVELLDVKGQPITLDGRMTSEINKDGTITQNGQIVARIGLFDVPDRAQLSKSAGSMLAYPELKRNLRAAPVNTVVRSEFVERANVEPSSELAMLMDAQRQLEANANMIRYQDQMLSKLVNEVGKIS